MSANILIAAARALAFAAISVSLATPAQAQSTAVEALQKARTVERLAEGMAVEKKGEAPGFVLDPAWPQPLPNHWVIGDVGGIAVDKHNQIWVYHRPRSVGSQDSGMQGAAGKDAKGQPISALGHPRPNGQINGCCDAAPSILVFNTAGKLLKAWGGPADKDFLKTKCREAEGCFWPAREHGIYVDHNDFVYIAGNGQARAFYGQYAWAPNFGDDSHILKFKADGTFLFQIGTAGAKGPNSNDTNGGVNGTPEPYWPADMVVDPKTNLMYIADGYGNRRVLIVDAATGKYVGHFGAYGQNPVVGENATGQAYGAAWYDDFKAGNMKPKFFRSPLHCARLANDGLLYACDRGNNRVQVFKASEAGKPCENPNGEAGKCGYVGEVHVAPQSIGGTSGTVNFSTDAKQSCMYVADLVNDVIYVVNRQNMTELTRVGGGGRQAGQFHWPHVVANDTDGNMYVGEVDGAARVQRFLRYGATGCSGTGSAEVGKYSVQ